LLTLFPYTTLFRSLSSHRLQCEKEGERLIIEPAKPKSLLAV
jgi:hypothetical protein